MSAQLYLFDVRRWGLWAELPRHVQALVATVEDAIIKRNTRGRLEGARRWSDVRLKMETAGLGKRAIRALEQRGFVRWDGDDLVLVHYDVSQEERAAKRAARLSDRGTRNANKRWHPNQQLFPAEKACDRNQEPDRASATEPSTAPVMAPATELCVNCSELLNSGHATGNATADASGDARARSPSRDDDPQIRTGAPQPPVLTGAPGSAPSKSDPVPPTHPLTEDRGCVGGIEAGASEAPVGGWVGSALSLGQMKVVRAYPKEGRPLSRMAEFRRLWDQHHLELHADWVIELIDQMRGSRRWLNGYVKLIDNFLEEEVLTEERPVVDGCTADCCRGKWKRAVVVEAGEVKPEPPPRYATPEEIAELRAFRKQGRVPT